MCSAAAPAHRPSLLPAQVRALPRLRVRPDTHLNRPRDAIHGHGNALLEPLQLAGLGRIVGDADRCTSSARRNARQPQISAQG